METTDTTESAALMTMDEFLEYLLEYLETRGSRNTTSPGASTGIVGFDLWADRRRKHHGRGRVGPDRSRHRSEDTVGVTPPLVKIVPWTVLNGENDWSFMPSVSKRCKSRTFFRARSSPV